MREGAHQVSKLPPALILNVLGLLKFDSSGSESPPPAGVGLKTNFATEMGPHVLASGAAGRV